MKCKELWIKYFTQFNSKVAFDIVFSCKICIVAVWALYVAAMYVKFIPVDVASTVLSRAVYSVIMGTGAAFFTMPLYLIGFIVLGMLIKFAKDALHGLSLIFNRGSKTIN